MHARSFSVVAFLLLAVFMTGYTQKMKETAHSEFMPNLLDRCELQTGPDIVNDCTTAACEARAEAAVECLADRTEQMFTVWPDTLFVYPTTLAIPGHSQVREHFSVRGVLDSLVTRFANCPSRFRPRISFDRRNDLMRYSGRPWTTNDVEFNNSAHGCPHGTMNHEHVTGESGVTANRCRHDVRVGQCSAGPRKDLWCPCYDRETGRLDPDGSCVDALDSYCNTEGYVGATCQLRPFDFSWYKTVPGEQLANATTKVLTTGPYSSKGYRILSSSGFRTDALCGDLTVANGVCNETPAAVKPYGDASVIPAGETAMAYLYQTFFDFDWGTNDPTSYSSKTNIAATAGTLTSVTVNLSPPVAENALVNGRVFIRTDSAYWEARPIVSNTASAGGGATTITVNGACPYGARIGQAGWCTAPAVGERVGVLSPGSSFKKHGIISGVLTDITNPAYQKWTAAAQMAALWDSQLPTDWPIDVMYATKMGMWAKAPANTTATPTPCSDGTSWEGINNFDLPTPYAGEGKCRTDESQALNGSPWTAGQYERAWCDIALALLANIEKSPFTDLQLSTVSAQPANRFAPTRVSTNAHWGICNEVQAHPKFAGSRVPYRTEATTFPFVAETQVCGNGVRQGSEECDDGNLTPGDGCSWCKTDRVEVPVCGNGTVQASEQCDDGNTITEGCSYGASSCTVCSSGCALVAGATRRCGDSTLNPGDGEQCDDGNTTAGDGCSATCQNEPSSTTITAVAEAYPIQHATTVFAPAAVYVTSLGSSDTDTASTRPTRVHEDLFTEWDCGAGSRSGTMPTRLALSWRYPVGHNAGCVFDTPGVQTITATVTNRAGDTDTAQATVTVLDPLDLNRRCNATDTDVSHCPAGSTNFTNVGTYQQAIANCGAGSYCVFKCGSTWTQSAPATFAAGPGVVSCLGGTGNRFNVNATSGHGYVPSGWTIAKMAWTRSTSGAMDSLPFDVGRQTFIDLTLRAQDRGFFTHQSAGPSHPDLVAFVNTDAEVVNGAAQGTGWSMNYLRASRALMLGNRWDANGGGEFIVRMIHHHLAAIEGNDWQEPQDKTGVRNCFQLRAISAANGPYTSWPTPTPSEDFYYGFNTCSFKGYSGANITGHLRVCQEDGCNASPGTCTEVSGGVIEGNLTEWLGGANPMHAYGIFTLQGGRMTVRGNAVRARGLYPSGDLTLVNKVAHQSQCTTQTNGGIEVYGNAMYDDTTSTGGTVFLYTDAAGASGSFAQGNLSWAPNRSGTHRDTVGGATAAGNYAAPRAGPNPWNAVPATVGSDLTLDDFRLRPGSEARDRGPAWTPTPAWVKDSFLTLRPQGTRKDPGIHEYAP